MSQRKKKPGYLLHKPSGQAYVRINGKCIYLGPHNEPESLELYGELIADWLKSKDVDRFSLTVDELAIGYLDRCRTYYRKNGKETAEVGCTRAALRILVADFGKTRARDFGPLKLQQVRDEMISLGWKRQSINQNIGRIRRAFKWATSQELVPATVLMSLQSVSGLSRGRSKAVESERVMPVAWEVVDACSPFMSRPIWGAVRLQWYSGMRPGEALTIRACDIEMTGPVWEYRPDSHKTEHHGRERIIPLGPKAQELLQDFLTDDPSQYLFSPRISGHWAATSDHYGNSTYSVAIQRSCEYAFNMPRELRSNVSKELRARRRRMPVAEREELRARAKQWRKAHGWHPNQLRHAAATEVRRRFGLEAAQVVLGHSGADVTQIYAERDSDLARQVAAEMG